MLPEDRKGITVSLDEKTVRSTSKMGSYGSPLHIISAVRQLVRELDLHDCVVVTDMLNCQRETAEAIVRGKGDYLREAKGDQPVLEEEIREYVQDESLRKTMDCESKNRKKLGSDGNADCIHYSRYKLAFREGEVEKSMLYWRNQDGI